jgi:hypothetical protein
MRGLVQSVIGVDPGSKGRAVMLTDERELITSKLEIVDLSVLVQRYTLRPKAGFEQVSSRPDDDPYTAFQFGKNVGKVLGVLGCLGLNIEEIPPQTWQREFGLGGKYKDQPARKRAHKQKAQELFPEIKVTLDTCDAILIAEYMWRKTFGELTHGKAANFIDRPGFGVTRSTRSLSDI